MATTTTATQEKAVTPKEATAVPAGKGKASEPYILYLLFNNII